jgi:rod shape-determining protein MreD
MIWRRSLLVLLLGVTGLAFQTVLGRTTLAGTKPELLLLIVVALGICEGPAIGATAGFCLGLATDLLLELPAGGSALTLTLVGYAAGRIRAQLQQPSAWLPSAMVIVATVTGLLSYAGLVFLLGEQSLSAPRILRNASLAAAYNALLTPFVFPVVRRLGARMRPVGVAR